MPREIASGIFSRRSKNFLIDSEGNAYFVGTIDASKIIGSTITGTTIKTSDDSSRIELSDSGFRSIQEGTLHGFCVFTRAGASAGARIYHSGVDCGFLAGNSSGSIRIMPTNDLITKNISFQDELHTVYRDSPTYGEEIPIFVFDNLICLPVNWLPFFM